MLVIIDGYVVDTERIYEISPLNEKIVVHDGCGTNSWGFEVRFLNNEKRFFGRGIFGFNSIEEVTAMRIAMKAARQSLIDYWNSSKSSIPEIKMP